MTHSRIVGAFAALGLLASQAIAPASAAIVAPGLLETAPLRSVQLVSGEGSLLYNLAGAGACFRWIKNPYGSLVCGAGVTFAEYVWNNRYGIAYLLAYSGGRLARVTTPCVIANGVKYYCL